MTRRHTTSSRGYGHRHQQLRRAWDVEVRTGRVRCARCRKPIRRGQAWDLGHTDDRRGYTGPEHATCNRAAGARKRHALRRDPPPRPVTRW